MRGAGRVLVVGVGNGLRRDDGAGLRVCRRLKERLGDRVETLEAVGPDIVLAETFSTAPRVLVLDAVEEGEPFRLVRLSPDEGPWRPGPCASHLFFWPHILAASRDLYGRVPEAGLLAVRGYDFGIGERLSPECGRNAHYAAAFFARRMRFPAR